MEIINIRKQLIEKIKKNNENIKKNIKMLKEINEKIKKLL
tara:strand:+ start:1771 stop:1890 length:120 start_codon:yes stop_codon:yes gene_type:complete